MASTELIDVSLSDEYVEQAPPSPEQDSRTNTNSLISVALSDIDEPKTPLGGSIAQPTKPETLIDLQDDVISLMPSEDDLESIQTESEPQTEVKEFAVPALPEPKPTENRRSTSRHVRAKSSLQEPDMAALLARLEMENQAIAKDPKAGIAAVGAHTGPGASFEYRVRDTVCSSLSLVTIPEEALGMNLGDFWALVTKDYQEALRVLPTVTPLMIHKGVPDFLRSAVWAGIAGAWDASLQVEFDSLCERLQHEKPINEHIINKDLARCFPHHDLFREADGEGQKMLGTVLKCYSLYDSEIGYCQGMAFVAGILLMNMPAKDAFCVFVKLMENHNMRTLYSLSLTGLHSRTYQLKKIMGQISPDLLNHLSKLGVELAYLSQWFMTMFATSCPLNILFRIYDVVFAEGADETMMRVALALILSNEHKIMAMKELEEVLHLLLGRRLWEPYQAEPDFLMDEIARLSNVVTREELDKLDKQFADQAAGESRDTTVRALGFTSGFSGFKFFEHFRAPSTAKGPARSPSSNTLLEMPGHLPRRSVSKRSVNTIDSSVGSGSGADSLMSAESQASTAATEFDNSTERGSTATFKSSRTARTEDRGLHEQVEGLLLALSEVQREAAETAAQLRTEHRRKESMAEIVIRLRDLVMQKEQVQETAIKRDRRKTMPSRIDIEHAQDVLKKLHRKSGVITSVARSVSLNNLGATTPDAELQDSLGRLCTLLETDDSPATGTPKSEIGSFFDQAAGPEQERVTRTKRRDSVRFAFPAASSASSNRSPTAGPSQENNHPTLSNPNTSTSSFADTPGSSPSESMDYWPEASMFDSNGASPHIQPRQSSLQARDVLRMSNSQTAQDEALLVELVNAKTREATAMHERDELKVQVDKLRKSQENREAQWTQKLHEMERLMVSQQKAMKLQEEAHVAELSRYKPGVKHKPSVVLSPFPESKTDRSNSLWPSAAPAEPPTPTKLQPPAAETGGGWGWFKQRKVSTGSVS
ncbi:Rab-GTPase-TBC domain-containing protein 8 [Elsinoe australis]|uniref:Rab-GTPase-TBC domain-containing protein 8 n=1 Tax=Elsinoe australis TaxID=40998 RepID=A0A4U7AXI6_9PEZI|nr:Rab-GTPase-TBC domain-containing protein 8 [Elsinoe australis]